jgi:predicted dehydrogenase
MSSPYAPEEIGLAGPRGPVVAPGEFVFAAAFFEHAHLFGQCDALLDAGATLAWVYDPDAAKAAALQTRYPQAKLARTFDEILDDPTVRLVTAAAVPSERCSIGLRVLRAGKDYFTDKAPLTSLAQLAEARRVAAETGRKYAVYYSERLHNEAALHATQLIARGVIGKVVQVVGFGPHRIGRDRRPAWFYDKARSGGILCDLASHQFEQFLTWTGADRVDITHALVANHAHRDAPEFEDYGEASLCTDTGTTGFVRVDWLTPDGLGTWGDGRSFILGTRGYIELRKYIDVARERTGSHVYVVDGTGEHHIPVAGRIGFPFFGQLIRDCLERTEHAMTQAHIFRVAELTLRVQLAASRTASPALAAGVYGSATR